MFAGYNDRNHSYLLTLLLFYPLLPRKWISNKTATDFYILQIYDVMDQFHQPRLA